MPENVFHPFSTGALGLFPTVMLHAAIAGYVIAAVMALAALFAPARARMAWADAAAAISTGALLAYFLSRFISAGMAPFSSLFEVMALSALALASAYHVAARTRRFPSMGAFALPAVALTLLVSLPVAGSVDRGADQPAGALTAMHVLLTVLANGALVMASVAAGMFLMQERALRRHHTPRIVRHFPPLEALRRLLAQCVWVGLPLLTVGLALGFASRPPSQWGVLLATPKVMSALMLWAVFAAAVFGKAAGWLHGRRHSYLILAGFALVVLTYAALGLFVSQAGGDAGAVSQAPGGPAWPRT